jgi:GDP-mannose 6-dehydrogenase
VGTATAAYLANVYHDVVGVDINQHTIDLVNSGRAPVIEPGLDELVRDAVQGGKLKATFDSRSAVLQSELSIIAVAAPVTQDGGIDTTVLKRVCTKLGQVLAQKESFHTFVMRGSAAPGTTEDVVIPILEDTSGKKVFLDFDVCVNPHFLRAGSVVHDCKRPPIVLIGQQDDRAGNRVVELFDGSKTTVVRTSIRSSELIWHMSNLYRTFKQCFSIEAAALCKSAGTDAVEVMDVLSALEQPNFNSDDIGSFSLRTDQAGMNLAAIKQSTDTTTACKLPLLESFEESQIEHVSRVVALVGDSGKGKVGIAGVTVSPGSAELRGSTMIAIASALRAKGHDVRVFDHALSAAHARLPIKLDESIGQSLIDSMAGSMDELFNWADVIVIGHKEPEFEYLASLDAGKTVIDLVRVSRDITDSPDSYVGLYW